MTIKTIAIITAFLLTATPTQARPDLSREFCGDRYCGYHGNYETHHKLKKKVAHKEKKRKGTLPLPRSKPLIVEGAEFDQIISFSASNLVAIAKRYLGTNPTGWASLWCGRFMAMIAPQAAKRIPNPNLAINWAKLPRVSPRVGAILITRRNGGNHVGVVIGFDKRNNPITISGNHNRKVGIGTYHKSRIVAYVSA